MKKLLLNLIVSTFAFNMQAQTTENVLYLNVTRSTGAIVSAKLSDAETAKNPVVDLINRKAYVNGITLNLSRVSNFSFEIREEEVDGIKPVIEEETTTDNSNIYSIDGRIVRKNAKSSEGLPKGIYIQNGKKFVVK